MVFKGFKSFWGNLKGVRENRKPIIIVYFVEKRAQKWMQSPLVLLRFYQKYGIV